MKNKNIKLLIAIIAIGLIASVVVCLLTGICKKPTIAEHEFNYLLTYKLNGEIKTIEGTYTCKFNGADPGERFYTSDYIDHGFEGQSGFYTIEKKGDFELCIIMRLDESYLMGDTKNYDYKPSPEAPYIVVYDLEGAECEEPEILDMFDIEIVSWEYPEPIKNTFVFAGFAELSAVSMFLMLLIAIRVFVACLIFVKRDPLIVYKDIDKVSILFNVLLAVGGLPIATLVGWLIQAFPTGADWIYAGYLIVPPIAVVSLAASVSLRRTGFSKTGFFIQFVSPVIFFVLVAAEYLL